jgi:riboflavin kinase
VELSILRGKVVSGMGNFSYWIEKLHGHYFRKTGMKLFPGTLNVQLDQPYVLPKQIIRLEGEEYGGSVSVNIVPVRYWGRVRLFFAPMQMRTAEVIIPERS